MPINSPRKQTLILAGAVLGFVFLLAGSRSLGADKNQENPVEADLKYMPEGCNFVLSVNVEDLRASDVYKNLAKEIPEVAKEVQGDFGTTGVPYANVARISIGTGTERGKDLIGVFRFKKAMTVDEIKANKKSALPKFHKEVKMGGSLSHVVYGMEIPSDEFSSQNCAGSGPTQPKEFMMRFYTKQHQFYRGIYLHARPMFLRIRSQSAFSPPPRLPGWSAGS